MIKKVVWLQYKHTSFTCNIDITENKEATELNFGWFNFQTVKLLFGYLVCKTSEGPSIFLSDPEKHSQEPA